MKGLTKKAIAHFALLAVGLAIVAAAPLIFGDGNDIATGAVLLPPSPEHWFGTDNMWRDLVGRSLVGLRLSLTLAIVIQVISFAVGVVIGGLSGYYGGVIDHIYVAIQNVMMSFPSLVMSLCLILLLGTGIEALIIAISVTSWVSYARLVRGEVLTMRTAGFVTASRAIGCSEARLLFRHIIPNVIRPLIPLCVLMLGHTVLSIAGLSFLGFGVQPPTAEIGLMVNDGMNYLTRAPWLFLMPGVVLVAYTLLFNVCADDLQDRLNPQDQLYSL